MRSFAWGCLALGIAVAFGAFGAHGLKPILSTQALGTWRTGVDYQMIHGIALCLVGLASERLRGVARSVPCFGAGICLFSGSLYALALTGIKVFGAIAPIGGALLIAGWGLAGWAAIRVPRAVV